MFYLSSTKTSIDLHTPVFLCKLMKRMNRDRKKYGSYRGNVK